MALGGETMGTTWSLRAGAPEQGLPAGVRERIEAVLGRVIAQMSNWEPASDISRFNRAPLGTWQDIPDDFRAVLHAGLGVARRSGGAFDPAIGQCVDRWGFGPAPREVATKSPAGGFWTAIELDGTRARRMADVALDFCGIAKGFAVDAVAHALQEAGLRHFIIEIGGELRGVGVKPDGQPWWVDIEAPPGLALPRTRVALSGLAVATSGDYRRYFEDAGIRHAHSIDPQTGAPVLNAVASVTILHESAMLADAWATALMVSGPARGADLAEREGLAALIVTRTLGGASEYLSPALTAML